ncbi:MAG: hypothetical protein U0168_03440 [Nannocystaceae bacterium]|jgi:hypothetical protein
MLPRFGLTLVLGSLLSACGADTKALEGTWTCNSNDGGSGQTLTIAGDKITRKYSSATMEGTFKVKEAKGDRFVIDVTLDMDGKPFPADAQEIVLGDGGKSLSIKNTKNGSGADCTRG